MGRGPSFKDMVKSMSKKESLASLEKNAPKNQPVNETDRHVENIEKAENVSSEVSGKSVKNTAEDNQVKEEVASASKKEISNICDILVNVGACKSKSEARNIIAGGGVKVNDDTISDFAYSVSDEMKANGFILHKGKKVHIKIVSE